MTTTPSARAREAAARYFTIGGNDGDRLRDHLAHFLDRFEAEIRADEREQIQTWLLGCSGSYRAKTVADAIQALEHKPAIRENRP